MNRFERYAGPILALTLIIALIGCLAVTEVILSHDPAVRAIDVGSASANPPRYIRMREWVPNTEYVAAPPAIRRLHPGGTVLDVYPLTIDDNGFIAPSRIHDAPELSVVFLGGSTTECMFVQPELRFPYLAGRLLEERLGLRTNAYNGGMSGNNTLHSLHLLTGKVLPMRPTYVVLMHNVNDLALLSRGNGYWTSDSTLRQVWVRPAGGKGFEYALTILRDLTIPHTYRALLSAGRRLRALFGQVGTAQAEIVRGAPGPDDMAGQPPVERWAKDYESALRQFVATARAWHIRPVLMTMVVQRSSPAAERQGPAEGDYLAADRLGRRGFTGESFATAHDYFNETLRMVARSEGALLIDLAAMGPWTDDDLYDGLHFTDHGSGRVAGYVADAISGDAATQR